MINLKIISTGSKGNAVLLDNQILIDCGVPYCRLSALADRIKYIFLTHRHSDHLNTSTLRRLCTEHPSIKVIYNGYLAGALYKDCSDFIFKSSFITEPRKWYQIGAVTFENEMLIHDVPNCAWKIFIKSNYGDTFRVIYATDTNSLEHIRAKGYELYLIEANYDKDEIIKRMKEKTACGGYMYEDRVLKTHLSKQQADEWLYKNMGEYSSFIYMHTHED